MDDDLSPNEHNQCFWSPEGAYLLSRLVVLRLRDRMVNEGPQLDAAIALTDAAHAIAEIEKEWRQHAARRAG